MAEKKRQCGTCRFFAQTESGLNGKCTHPKRDRAHLDLLLLRPNELGCRTRWGTSLWQDPADDRDPESLDIPQQPTLPEPVAAQLHFDDEVTSVSIAGSKTARPSFEDDVVDSGAVSPGMGSWSDSLQEERRRLLMHSSQEALAGARKRHMEKQSRQRPLIPFADEEAEATPQDPKEDVAAAAPTTVAASESSFPPDDFVEDERVSDDDSQSHDDELVDDGLRPGISRSPRVRKLMRDTKSPKDHKAMGLGAPSEMAVTSHNPERREQWNSVPSMTPGFELPLMAPVENRSPQGSTLRVSASAAPMAYTQTPARPVSQARELMSEDRLRQERARRHLIVPMAESHTPKPDPRPTTSPVTNRPRLNHVVPEQAAPVERLKSSPLRGYHPAVKAAAARHAEETAPRSRTSSSMLKRDDPVRNRPAAGEHREVTRQTAPSPVQHSRPNPYQGEGPRHSRPMRPEAAKQERRPEPQRPKDTTPFVGSTIEIAPQVPRCCGTCASFRPSGVPGRGSCANEYAGPVQRVVNEQDLACQHTFGCFWLPADEEVWLDELTEDRAATPRVDRMIARRTQRKPVVLPDLEELTS